MNKYIRSPTGADSAVKNFLLQKTSEQFVAEGCEHIPYYVRGRTKACLKKWQFGPAVFLQGKWEEWMANWQADFRDFGFGDIDIKTRGSQNIMKNRK